MKNIKELVLLFSIFCLIQLQLTESFCIIRYPEDVEVTPIYAKTLGKHTVYLPYNGQDLYLSDGETIQGYCRTNFTSITFPRQIISEYDYDYYNNRRQRQKTVDPPKLVDQSSITLNCDGDSLQCNGATLPERVYTCNKLSWSAYDTNEVYNWCEKNENAKTFLLAAKSSSDHHILAEICFDLKEWSFLTIAYNVTSSYNKIYKEIQRDITKTNLKGFKSLGDELSTLKNNYFGFTEENLQQQLGDLSQTNNWLNLANYELSSIVQGVSYKNYFKEFVETLNIIWWRNLRLGNWKNFMNTLEHYSSNNNFQVYSGTSGTVKIPSRNSAEDNVLEMKNGYLNKTVPGYIWSYITSTDNKNADFIIVGYNSPYAEWFDINEVVFCPDICSHIPWLKGIISSFRYSTAGIMFCCSPEFVRQTNLLHGFPLEVLVARSVIDQNVVLQIESTTQNFISSSDRTQYY